MGMARESELERQCREILVMRKLLEGPRQPQAQMIAVQRQAFDLLEELGEIDG